MAFVVSTGIGSTILIFPGAVSHPDSIQSFKCARRRRCSFFVTSTLQSGPCDDDEDENARQPFSDGRSNNSDADQPPVTGDARVFRGSSGQELSFRGDSLPFDLRVISPPPHTLGRFMLSPRTSCGDVIEHDAKSYVVKRVRCHYRFERSGPTMFKKTVEIKSIARKSIENYLERTFRES